MRRQPIRTCIGCRGKFPQKTLIRFVSLEGQMLQHDEKKKLPGSGAYVCLAETCIQKAFFRKNSKYRLLPDVSSHQILQFHTNSANSQMD